VTRFIAYRLLQAIPVLLVVITATFFLVRVAPGGPFDSEKAVLPEVKAALEAQYRLDQPLLSQYTAYLGDLFQGDLGPSFKYPGRTVNELIAAGLPVTAELGLYALLFAVLAGVTAGVIASLKPNTAQDYVPMSLAMIGICMPALLLGPLLLLVFGIRLDWLPVSGWGDLPGDKILPSLTLGAGYAAYLTGVGRDALGAVFAGGGIVEPIDGRYTVLLLGGDAGPDRVGLRPDSITLASIDASSGAVSLIGIPRNLYNAPVPADSPLAAEWPNGFDCGDDCLISYLYPWAEERPELYPAAAATGSTPGIEAMRDAVEGVTGLPVQFTVLIDMAGFEDLIDALGGVVIDVEEPITLGINGGPVVGEIAAGEQRMDGETALWYARSRYNLTDFDRMEHQRDVQEAMLRQLDPATVLTRFEAIAEASSDLVRTDVPQSMIGVFTDLAVRGRELPLRRVELVPPAIDNVLPDYALARILVAEAVAPLPTPTPTP